jgi:hypothetical protein
LLRDVGGVGVGDWKRVLCGGVVASHGGGLQ